MDFEKKSEFYRNFKRALFKLSYWCKKIPELDNLSKSAQNDLNRIAMFLEEIEEKCKDKNSKKNNLLTKL